MTVEVRAHDKHDKCRFQQGINSFRNGGGGAICERRKQTTNRWSRGPGGWNRGLQGCNAPLSKKMLYLMGIKYLISFPCSQNLLKTHTKLLRKDTVNHFGRGCKVAPPCLRNLYFMDIKYVILSFLFGQKR